MAVMGAYPEAATSYAASGVCFPVAQNTLQHDAQVRGTSLGRHDPGTQLPGRVMPNMLSVPTAELGHPVLFLVLVKSNDGLLHVSPAKLSQVDHRAHVPRNDTPSLRPPHHTRV
jgi:hypothetical protein